MSIKGPAVFLAQFMDDHEPYNSLDGICGYMADLGYKGVQIPTWDSRLIDLDLAAESKDYCDELAGKIAQHGMEITELSTHLQGQMVAVHPAYDDMYDGLAPAELRGKPSQRTEWAKGQVRKAVQASAHLGLKVHATFSGALLWPMMYPWPQRPAGLVEVGFRELADRWMPLLDHAADHGVKLCYEIHPGEDLHDGVTWEMFHDATSHHKAAGILYDPSHFLLQQLDYLQFIDLYHEHIGMFHVKDAEFNPTGRSGVYGGYQGWKDRAGRFRSPGDGQIDFSGIFARLTQYGYSGWAVMEWECCIKSAQQGAKEGAGFISSHLIDIAGKSFDDFAGMETDLQLNKKILGL